MVQSKYVSAGFDGFIDYIVKPVKTRSDETTCTYMLKTENVTALMIYATQWKCTMTEYNFCAEIFSEGDVYNGHSENQIRRSQNNCTQRP